MKKEYPQTAVTVVVDVEDSTSRTDMDSRAARKETYAWVKRTLGPIWSACHHEDRGDGVLMMWPQMLDKATPAPEILSALLRLPATASTEGPRLRVAVHTGQVFQDEHGHVGRGLNQAFALNEADLLKTALNQAEGPVAYLISNAVHDATVGYGYKEFEPFPFYSAVVQTKESQMHAWLHIPGGNKLAARLAARTGPKPPAGEPSAPEPQQTSSVNLTVGGDAKIGKIAGRDLYL